MNSEPQSKVSLLSKMRLYYSCNRASFAIIVVYASAFAEVLLQFGPK